MLKCIASCDIVTISKELYETHIKKASIFVVIKKSKESLNAPDFAFLLVHYIYPAAKVTIFYLDQNILMCRGGAAGHEAGGDDGGGPLPEATLHP
jgi:hypothetical protein